MFVSIEGDEGFDNISGSPMKLEIIKHTSCKHVFITFSYYGDLILTWNYMAI